MDRRPPLSTMRKEVVVTAACSSGASEVATAAALSGVVGRAWPPTPMLSP